MGCRPSDLTPSNKSGASSGLLRQYLAKGADLRTFAQADLDAIAAELNDRPRRVLGYRSAAEVWTQHILTASLEH